jgi:hypothetical protein
MTQPNKTPELLALAVRGPRRESAVAFVRRRTMRIIAFILFCAAVASLSSCARMPSTPQETVYGTPGTGMVQVIIRGDVKHPGKYWISNNSNLATVEYLFGGWGGHGDGGIPPHRVRLTRTLDRDVVRTDYRLSMPADQKAAITLKDGDVLFYPAVIF